MANLKMPLQEQLLPPWVLLLPRNMCCKGISNAFHCDKTWMENKFAKPIFHGVWKETNREGYVL